MRAKNHVLQMVGRLAVEASMRCISPVGSSFATTSVNAKEKILERNNTDQIDTGIFDNHINVFGPYNAPIFIMSIPQINANLEEWAMESEIPNK